jgi:hypothetical protein
MKKTISGIIYILLAISLAGMVSAENNDDADNSMRCHDTDRGIDPFVFGSIRAGSLFVDDRCFIDDQGVALVFENYCKAFDNWCYDHGVVRNVNYYPSFYYNGYNITVSEANQGSAVFHITKEGEDKEYNIMKGEVMKTMHGIIIMLDNVYPATGDVVYSLANEYFATETLLCTGGCFAGACIGDTAPIMEPGCRAPRIINNSNQDSNPITEPVANETKHEPEEKKDKKDKPSKDKKDADVKQDKKEEKKEKKDAKEMKKEINQINKIKPKIISVKSIKSKTKITSAAMNSGKAKIKNNIKTFISVKRRI